MKLSILSALFISGVLSAPTNDKAISGTGLKARSDVCRCSLSMYNGNHIEVTVPAGLGEVRVGNAHAYKGKDGPFLGVCTIVLHRGAECGASITQATPSAAYHVSACQLEANHSEPNSEHTASTQRCQTTISAQQSFANCNKIRRNSVIPAISQAISSTSASTSDTSSDEADKSMLKERPEKQKMSKPDFSCVPTSHCALRSSQMIGTLHGYTLKKFRCFNLSTTFAKDEESDHALQSVTAEDTHLVELWVLADKLADPELQNCAIDHKVQMGVVCEWPAHKNFNYKYENTATDSQLRLLAVQQCRNHKRGVFEKDGECFPKLLLLDMIITSPEIPIVNLSSEDFYVDVPNRRLRGQKSIAFCTYVWPYPWRY
ncbi:uncharacterized protein RCO7_02252 [Rhynchosporium graminicola]|uniref:Cyanovirin-N domain-containing protein n=1 Tax=Rhynchosporium graminicola TaxID=2792576 RepID=A0A1E1LHD8_9HELO|nr:uncharacterized protein RCO7_02252 [Rhynchosporium commune]